MHGYDQAAPRRPRSPTAGNPAAAQRDSARTASVRSVLRLQRAAGNAAVTRMFAGARPTVRGSATVQRLVPGPAACPAPPAAPVPAAPEKDPAFAAVKGKIGAAQQAATKHPPTSAEATAAQNAAVAPPDDKNAQAKTALAGEMGAVKPAPFDKAAFIAAVNKAIAAQAPKTLDEADKFASSGKADNVKAEVIGKVTRGKEDSTKPLAEKSQQSPDTSKALDKPVIPLPTMKPGIKPAPLDAAKAMPPKAPAEQTNLGAPKCETDRQMAEVGVTEGQLAKSNEPQFTEAVTAKKESEAHSARAPAQVRQSEAQQLTAARAGAQDAGQAAAAAMAGAHGRVLQQVAGQQGATKSADEATRAQVTGPINAIFDKTKTDVTSILSALDGLVSAKFEEGERAAKAAFTADHQVRMQRYKDQRYSGPAGWLRWTGDLFADLPAEANQLFVESRKLYESKMQVVISEIADLVGRELTRAKERIAAGRAEIAKHVAGLSPELRKVGAEAAREIGGKFDDLDASVDEKSQSLVDELASKYVEARNAVDEEIKSLQEQNKGLWSKAKEAVGGAIETILKLKDMLLGVLARAAGAIENIIKDPIGFLGKFVNAVKTGITNFAANIVDHLKKGLQGWLLGSLANAGVELPEKFDLKGIVKLILSLLGLTWSGIRARLMKFIPEPVLVKIEQTVEIFRVLVTEGVAGLWKWIVGKLTDLKDMVMGRIRDFVITRIVKAGITWLISLLNPAAAFIKACKMIYDVVMFFVEKADQIKEFIDSVLDSIESIAKGGVGAVAGYIEKTLAKTLPVVLGFLASLLGLGGISEKIKEVLKAAQEKVGEAVDWVIKKALKVAAPLIKAFKKSAGFVKKKYEAAKAYVKKQYEAGKAYVKKLTGKDKRQDDIGSAVKAGHRLLTAKHATVASVRSAIPALKQRFGLRAVNLVSAGQLFHLHLQRADADTLDVLLGPGSDLEDARKQLGKKFVVTETHRVATVTTVHEAGFVILTYDLQRTLGGRSQSREVRPSFRISEFLDNLKNNGPALLPAAGGANQTKYTLDGKTLRPEYRNVRAIFYRFGYKEHRPSKMGAVARPDGTFMCPGWKRKPHLVPQVEGQLDHIRSVASHWKSEGYKQPQSMRESFDTNEANLQILCEECNGKKNSYDEAGGKGTYDPIVQIPNFSGPDGDS